MNKKYQMIAMLMLVAGGLSAQSESVAQSSPISLSTILIAINAVLLIFIVLLLGSLTTSVKNLKQAAQGKVTLTFWEKFAALKSEKSEEELTMDEDYDGITELDNPTPPWFNFIFYTTIIIAVIYLSVFHVFKVGNLQAEEYKVSMKEAETAKNEYLKKLGNQVDENNVTLLKDQKVLTEAAGLFKQNCVVCHGEKGEGKVGPNLTDQYWLHGGGIKDIFKTIKYGVPSKGMIAWQNSFSGRQMQELASYIHSLGGTNPPSPKAPQGDIYVADSTAKDSIIAIAAVAVAKTDSVSGK